MKKHLFFALILVMSVSLAACGGSSSSNTVEDASEEDAGAAQVNGDGKEEQSDQSKEKSQKTEEPSEIGVRSNPVPLGESVTTNEVIFGDEEDYKASLDISITEVLRGKEAWNIIKEENQFNEEPKEGFEYALLKIKGELSESETEDYPYWFSSADFSFVDQDGGTYESISTVIPDELGAEMYNGGTEEGYIVNQVKINEDFMVAFESIDGPPVFFQSK
ncbi:hypothetical protein [Halobacillus karajensis]|uniref:hypothetical protein n=1 Tax=Halobacillus karajensis TaxID=195088 RepID=UPI00045C656E|nr:hypothetical protein [Halobacillus karajensis]CDQ17925.1 hypothetical protein BN982_00165 [Halobacillus karajensis]